MNIPLNRESARRRKSLFLGLERGNGCILAHCMGLGKTLIIVALISTLLCNPAAQAYIPKANDVGGVKTSPSKKAGGSSVQLESKSEKATIAEHFSPSRTTPDPRKLFHCILVLAPVNTLRNWEAEFRKWLPADFRRSVKVLLVLSDDTKLEARVEKVLRWKREGGVLIMGYDLFKSLTMEEKYYNNVYKKRGKDVYGKVKNALCDPGTCNGADASIH
jgi:hypothetical protein